ncbi:SPOR domain-containing protein [Vibrio sp. ZSDZ34]|jgi:hypothetical protein|uniref:SPOR domain-containing protein n=1 Tax=Vibrio gelatinilyticus TaxID=2893468 RepID=A0A9X1WCB1_9VIBR|nr:SPOR domain-containing protein [Vibrio gelatinilyticus]MCJ2377671.1 SPOR domain-containing protein [Vibrio gelatinilyticus]
MYQLRKILFVVTPMMVSFSWASTPELTCNSIKNDLENRWYLSQDCPIGKGVWGDPRVHLSGASYWIQCGFVEGRAFRTLPKQFIQTTNASIWFKQEDRSKRCLIGPFDNFKAAKSELLAVKQVRGLNDAFIRSVDVAIRVTSNKHATSQKQQGKSRRKVTPYMIAGQHGRNDCQCYF